jgi:hypothetical protein
MQQARCLPEVTISATMTATLLNEFLDITLRVDCLLAWEQSPPRVEHVALDEHPCVCYIPPFDGAKKVSVLFHRFVHRLGSQVSGELGDANLCPHQPEQLGDGHVIWLTDEPKAARGRIRVTHPSVLSQLAVEIGVGIRERARITSGHRCFHPLKRHLNVPKALRVIQSAERLHHHGLQSRPGSENMLDLLSVSDMKREPDLRHLFEDPIPHQDGKCFPNWRSRHGEAIPFEPLQEIVLRKDRPWREGASQQQLHHHADDVIPLAGH